MSNDAIVTNILGTVGAVGKNRPSKWRHNFYDDVIVVQKLINRVLDKIPNIKPLNPDGDARGLTVGAIKEFQKVVLGFKDPDGRVDPNGSTHNKLVELSKPKAPVAKNTSGILWPLLNNVIRRNAEWCTFGYVRTYRSGPRKGKPKPHQGWDFAAALGTDAFAIADGKVIYTRDTGNGNRAGYGLQICISFEFKGKTYYSFYGHMQSLTVKEGDTVLQGQKIGTTGKTGNAWNQGAIDHHLHFEIRTKARCGLGLGGRLSPIKIYGKCPLRTPARQARTPEFILYIRRVMLSINAKAA